MGQIAETYQCKQCAQEAINRWWPGEMNIGGREFMPSMRALQVELIQCHFDDMPDDAKERAVKTLMWLESEQ